MRSRDGEARHEINSNHGTNKRDDASELFADDVMSDLREPSRTTDNGPKAAKHSSERGSSDNRISEPKSLPNERPDVPKVNPRNNAGTDCDVKLPGGQRAGSDGDSPAANNPRASMGEIADPHVIKNKLEGQLPIGATPLRAGDLSPSAMTKNGSHPVIGNPDVTLQSANSANNNQESFVVSNKEVKNLSSSSDLEDKRKQSQIGVSSAEETFSSSGIIKAENSYGAGNKDGNGQSLLQKSEVNALNEVSRLPVHQDEAQKVATRQSEPCVTKPSFDEQRIAGGHSGDAKQAGQGWTSIANLSVPVHSDGVVNLKPVDPVLVPNESQSKAQPLVLNDSSYHSKEKLTSASPSVDLNRELDGGRSKNETAKALDHVSTQIVSDAHNEKMSNADREVSNKESSSIHKDIDKGRLEAIEKEGEIPKGLSRRPTGGEQQDEDTIGNKKGMTSRFPPSKIQGTSDVPVVMPPGLPGLKIRGNGLGQVADGMGSGVKGSQDTSSEKNGTGKKGDVRDAGSSLGDKTQEDILGKKNNRVDASSKEPGPRKGSLSGQSKEKELQQGNKSKQDVPVILPPGLPGFTISTGIGRNNGKGVGQKTDKNDLDKEDKPISRSADAEDATKKNTATKNIMKTEKIDSWPGQIPFVIPPGFSGAPNDVRGGGKNNNGTDKDKVTPVNGKVTRLPEGNTSMGSGNVIKNSGELVSWENKGAPLVVQEHSPILPLRDTTKHDLIPEIELVGCELESADRTLQTVAVKRSEENSYAMPFVDRVDENENEGSVERRLTDFVRANQLLLEAAIKSGATSLLSEFSQLASEIGDKEEITNNQLHGEKDKERDSDSGFQRDQYVVKAGDTLESIALELYDDPLLGALIGKINSHKIVISKIDNRPRFQLEVGMRLFMPTNNEITVFQSLLNSPSFQFADQNCDSKAR